MWEVRSWLLSQKQLRVPCEIESRCSAVVLRNTICIVRKSLMTIKEIIERRAMIIMLLYMSIWNALRVVHVGVVD
jgi:hypothetical protein